MKSLVRPENDVNVLEEEASVDDVDVSEAIEDKTPVEIAPTVPVVLSIRTWDTITASSTASRCKL